MKLELDVGATLAVPLELEKGEKLVREFLVGVVLNFLECQSEPNPASEMVELLLNPECTKSCEVNPMGVLKLPQSQGVEMVEHAACGDGKLGSLIVIFPVCMIPREVAGLLRVIALELG